MVHCSSTRHTVRLANRLPSELQLLQQDWAIVSIPIADAAARLQSAGIRASVRAGAVPVAFQLYNSENDLDWLLDALGVNRAQTNFARIAG
jgi:hypothetical protein